MNVNYCCDLIEGTYTAEIVVFIRISVEGYELLQRVVLFDILTSA